MKGLIFTELLELVEERFGYATANKIVESSLLPSGGVYTAVGTYDHKEVYVLVDRLSLETGIPSSALYRVFGEHLFSRLAEGYPYLIRRDNGLFAFLESIHGYIHIEVKKMYPDSQLPDFECTRISENVLQMLYRSERNLGDLAYGLITGAIAFFGVKGDVQMEEQSRGVVLFTVTLQ